MLGAEMASGWEVFTNCLLQCHAVSWGNQSHCARQQAAALHMQIQSFLPGKRDIKVGATPMECPPSLLTMRCKSRKRVEPRAGPWTMMRSKSAEASLRNYKSWECHERIVPPFRGRSASALLFSSRWLFACLSHSGAPQGINRSIEKHGFTSSLAQLMRSRHCETEAAPLCGVKPRRMPQPISHTAICSIAQPGISSGTMLSQARWFSSFVIAGLHPAYVYIHIHNVYIYILQSVQKEATLYQEQFKGFSFRYLIIECLGVPQSMCWQN